jgi:hypothetical protein
MDLREVLSKMVEKKLPLLLSDGSQDWEAGALLESLSERKLKTNAHFQPGLYIAEVNEAGFMGPVLYRLKPKGDEEVA